MTGPYLPRDLLPLVQRALRALPVVVVTGLRQSGKTTLLHEDPALRGRRFLSLDDYATLEAARRAPHDLLEGDDPLTIDEAQRCPELLLAVKQSVDRRRARGRFLLSGSANFALLRGVAESLAGRAVYLALHPFTRRERVGGGGPPFLAAFFEDPTLPRRADAIAPVTDDDVLLGGMPAVATGETPDPPLWFRGYEQTYLDRDVRALSQVADLGAFRNVLRAAALRTGQLLNRAELARDVKLPVATVVRYLGLLETSFVTALLRPYLRSRRTRLLKSAKIFVADSGLAAHLTGVRDLAPVADEPLRGPLYETYVHQNLRALVEAHLPDAELAYWSVHGRHEVDFVIARGRRCMGIEVKAASRFGGSDVAGLRAFLEATPGAIAGVLAYNGTEAVPLGERVYAIPLARLLL